MIRSYYGVTDAALLDIGVYREVEEVVIPEITVQDYYLDYNAYDKKITIFSPENRSATVFAAAYNNGLLVSLAFSNEALLKDTGVLCDLSELETVDASQVKVFIWDSVTSLVPVTEQLNVQGVLNAE